MNFGFGKRVSEEDSGIEPDGLLDDPERLVKFAQSYFGSDFPNPSRLGCPSESALNKLIISEELPGDELRAHLFGCSECFRNYRRLLALRHQVQTESAPSWSGKVIYSFKQHPLPAFACLIALVIAAIAFVIWRDHVGKVPSDVARNASQPATTPIFEATPDVQPEASPQVKSNEQKTGQERVKNAERRPKELVAVNVAKIDLGKYSLLRDGAGMGGGPLIRFPAARNRLIVALPANSPKGLYTLSVVDAFGHELVRQSAKNVDGRRLIANMNMRALPLGKYHLCVALPSEAPDCYPLTVVHK